MRGSLVIGERFNGPPGSANGGYTCGLVAALLGAGTAEVSLRSPPPLERPLAVERRAGAVLVSDGETLVAEAHAARLELDTPEPVTVAEAERASRAGFERWSHRHPFPTCVVCGPERPSGDGFCIFPGPLPGSDGIFAAVWTPDAARAEYSWAALDCPTSAPVATFGQGPPIVLARLTARIDAAPALGAPHVVMSWPLGLDGRKRHAAAAIFSAEGRQLAVSRALWLELRRV